MYRRIKNFSLPTMLMYNNKYFFLLLSAFLFFTTLSVAQKKNVPFEKEFFPDKKALKKAVFELKAGDEQYENRNYNAALSYYEVAYKFNPNNAQLNFKMGVCYINSYDKLKSAIYFLKAEKLNPMVDPQIYYYLGRVYKYRYEWDKAIESFEKSLKFVNRLPDAKTKTSLINRNIIESKNGKAMMEDSIRVFIDNAGPNINGKFPDYSPVISADESSMIFTSRRDDTTDGLKSPADNEYFEDIYISEHRSSGWTKAKNIGKPINEGSGHEASIGYSLDGQTLFIYKSDNGGDIYESELEGNHWSKPQRMSKNINTKSHESSACLSPDGNTLYVISNREESRGKHDIFMHRKTRNGEWGKAINMGADINTPFDEIFVYAHPNGKTIYFGSNGHNTMGDVDIFKSTRNGGKWSTPENLGYPINTPFDDLDFSITASGRKGYYTTFRNEGYGKKDIYMITFLGPEKPVVMNTEDNLLINLASAISETVKANAVVINENNVTLLKGVITDKKSGQPLNATIEIVDNVNNEVISMFHSNAATGKYLVTLPSGKNYGIAVKKENYLFHSENFDLPGFRGYQEIVKDISLDKIDLGAIIVLKNIFFDVNKATLRLESSAELERIHSIMDDNPTIKIEISGHTDNVGSEDYNHKLSTKRAEAVVDWLMMHGVEGHRLIYQGYGFSKPIATNDTKEGRQKNRRTEFKIIEK